MSSFKDMQNGNTPEVATGLQLADLIVEPGPSIVDLSDLDRPGSIEQMVMDQISWAEQITASHATEPYIWGRYAAILNTRWVDVGTYQADGTPVQASMLAFYSVVNVLPRQASLRRDELLFRTSTVDRQAAAVRSNCVARFDNQRQAVLVRDPEEQFFTEGKVVIPGSEDWSKLSTVLGKIEKSEVKTSLMSRVINRVLNVETGC